MVSFYNLWEKIDTNNDSEEKLPPDIADGEERLPPLLDSGDDSKSMEVIRIGMQVSKDFWDSFSKLCNNTEGFSELLGVREDQVSEWPAKIKANLDKVSQSDTQNKSNLVSTGEVPPQVSDNSGGNDASGPVTFPDATKPTP